MWLTSLRWTRRTNSSRSRTWRRPTVFKARTVKISFQSNLRKRKKHIHLYSKDPWTRSFWSPRPGLRRRLRSWLLPSQLILRRSWRCSRRPRSDLQGRGRRWTKSTRDSLLCKRRKWYCRSLRKLKTEIIRKSNQLKRGPNGHLTLRRPVSSLARSRNERLSTTMWSSKWPKRLLNKRRMKRSKLLSLRKSRNQPQLLRKRRGLLGLTLLISPKRRKNRSKNPFPRNKSLNQHRLLGPAQPLPYQRKSNQLWKKRRMLKSRNT